MLAIRLQRTGRKGHAQFRVVVQESRVTPSSGRVVAYLGSYDPHTKHTSLVKDKAEYYVKNGAHPSPRVALLMQKEGVKLPEWVRTSDKREGKIRNLEKLRRNQPKEEAPAETPVEAEEQIVETQAPTEEAVVNEATPLEESPGES